MKIIRLALCTSGLAMACSNGQWQGSDLTLAEGTSGQRLVPVYSNNTAATPPPPISGGTLIVASDGHTAIASDPDRDVVWIANLATQSLQSTVSLQAGDEPGRVVEGPGNRAYVVLRGGGAVAAIDTSAGSVVGRYSVCAAPRGIAYDGTTQTLHVACAGGELVTLNASDGSNVTTLRFDQDLRDVVMDGSTMLVSRFRAAQLFPWQPGQTGQPETYSPADVASSTGAVSFGSGITSPQVAWRTVALPGGGGALMVHQLHKTDVLAATPNAFGGAAVVEYYSGGCFGGVVNAAVTQFSTSTGAVRAVQQWTNLPSAVLPVDLAVAAHTDRVVVVAAGNASIRNYPQIYTFHMSDTTTSCGFGGTTDASDQPNAQVTAAAFDGADNLVAQTREPPAIYLIDQHAVIPLPGASRADLGHEIFHGNSSAGVACASCHVEGGDDGHVWDFQDEGPRRTQNLQGGVVGSAPFHWAGELATFPDLVTEVFNRRMSGPTLASSQTSALGNWLNSVHATPGGSAIDPASVSRGQALFTSSDTQCTNCHNGDRMTNSTLVDVGTGGTFKVPSLLGVGSRAPYIHNGCAGTLEARFTDTACGGGDQHGHTSQLSASQIGDLVAYLQTL